MLQVFIRICREEIRIEKRLIKTLWEDIKLERYLLEKRRITKVKIINESTVVSEMAVLPRGVVIRMILCQVTQKRGVEVSIGMQVMRTGRL